MWPLNLILATIKLFSVALFWQGKSKSQRAKNLLDAQEISEELTAYQYLLHPWISVLSESFNKKEGMI